MDDVLIQKIQLLKKQRNAVILAHNYVQPEIQDLADFLGDSLELSRRAATLNADVIVFCGVRFMAETAKLLSPDSVVLLPNSSASCPMARMASSTMVANYKKEHPEDVLVAYVNSTAATKAHVDVCCTSGNVEKVLNSIPEDREIMFLPDRNLGTNMTRKLKRSMKLWNGCCPIHDAVTPEMIHRAREQYPEAEILIHPECRPEVVELCDAALSTGGMLRYAHESKSKEFVIATECGILHRLRKENPDKTFHPLHPELVCEDMKKITLEDVRDALLYNREEIRLSPEVMTTAREPIERMLAL